jgi:hypothetical protein
MHLQQENPVYYLAGGQMHLQQADRCNKYSCKKVFCPRKSRTDGARQDTRHKNPNPWGLEMKEP